MPTKWYSIILIHTQQACTNGCNNSCACTQQPSPLMAQRSSGSQVQKQPNFGRNRSKENRSTLDPKTTTPSKQTCCNYANVATELCNDPAEKVATIPKKLSQGKPTHFFLTQGLKKKQGAFVCKWQNTKGNSRDASPHYALARSKVLQRKVCTCSTIFILLAPLPNTKFF